MEDKNTSKTGDTAGIINLRASGILISTFAAINLCAPLIHLAVWRFRYTDYLPKPVNYLDHFGELMQTLNRVVNFSFWSLLIECLIFALALGLAARTLQRVPGAERAATTGLVGAIVVTIAGIAVVPWSTPTLMPYDQSYSDFLYGYSIRNLIVGYVILNTIVMFVVLPFGFTSLALRNRWSRWLMAAGGLGLIARVYSVVYYGADVTYEHTIDFSFPWAILFAVIFLAWSAVMLLAGVFMYRDRLQIG